jgi:hypothetical protein
MAITDRAVTAPVTPAGAPSVNIDAPAVKASGKTKGNQAFQDFKAKGAAIRDSESYDKATEGAKSNTIQFITCLGNPARVQKRTEAGSNKNSCQVVGYKLKALEDVEVPEAPITSKANIMEHGEITSRLVKAGEEFDVTCFELGALISRPEYAGKFTGGGDEVMIHVTMSSSRNNEPLTVLKRKNSPIKDQMTKIATEQEDGSGRKSYTVDPAYADKFGILFARKKKAGGSAASALTGESPMDLAAAFQAYLKEKGGR